MNHLLQDIIRHPGASLAVIGNLVIIESLLSVDNAAVLATMVMDLPAGQRNKALKYGIWGAYVFRGLAMISVSFLIRIWWLKALGGAYLLYLAFDWWRKRSKKAQAQQEETIDKKRSWLYRMTLERLGRFWATVALVELMDIAFSIDNVFAAVAFSPNIILVCTGVFIGILAMRFVAQAFVRLMARYPFLEAAAYAVIGILGLKLVLSLWEHFAPQAAISRFLAGHAADMATSLVTIAVFLLPLLSSLLFNYPRRHEEQ